MTDGAPSADASSGQGGPDGYRPGWWPSPLSAAQVAAPGSRPSEVQVADGSIFWAESRPDEDGRVAVVRWNPEAVISLAPSFLASSCAPSFIFTKKGLVSVLVIRPITGWPWATVLERGRL